MGLLDTKPVVGEAQAANGELPARDREKFPNVSAWLTATRYGDGAARTPGSLSLFFANGTLTVSVRDRDGKRVGFTSVPSLVSLLERLDSVLAEGRLDWRPDKPWKGGR